MPIFNLFDPKLGTKRISPDGKEQYWGGKNHGWQSPESYRLIDNIPGNAEPDKEEAAGGQYIDGRFVGGAEAKKTNLEKLKTFVDIPVWTNFIHIRTHT